MISDVIRELQEILDSSGDMPCGAKDQDGVYCTKIDVCSEPKYWDGGCKHPAVDTDNHVKHWVRSRKQDMYPVHCLIESDGPSRQLEFDEHEDDTIDGEPVIRVMDTSLETKPLTFLEPDSYALHRMSRYIYSCDRKSFNVYYDKYLAGFRTTNDMRYLRHMIDFINKQSDKFKADFLWTGSLEQIV